METQYGHEDQSVQQQESKKEKEFVSTNYLLTKYNYLLNQILSSDSLLSEKKSTDEILSDYNQVIQEKEFISFPKFLVNYCKPLVEPIKLQDRRDPQPPDISIKAEFKIDIHGLSRRGIKQAIFRLLANAQKNRSYKITFFFLPHDNEDFRRKSYQQIKLALENLSIPWIIQPSNEELVVTNSYKDGIVLTFPYQPPEKITVDQQPKPQNEPPLPVPQPVQQPAQETNNNKPPPQSKQQKNQKPTNPNRLLIQQGIPKIDETKPNNDKK